MFFSKASKINEAPLAKIIVIGTSPQAFFISSSLQNNNCAVTNLLPPSKIQKYAKNNVFTICPSDYQSRRHEFSFASVPAEQADFIFVASSPEDINNDLLLLAHPLLKNAPIINLSFLFNKKIIGQTTDKKTFPAFCRGFFNLEKNTLTFLKRTPEIEICASSDFIKSLKQLFENTPLSFTKISDEASLFWQNLIPFFLGNIISLAEKKNVSDSLLLPSVRKLADSALNELFALTEVKKTALDASQILPQLYSFPDNYAGEIFSIRQFNAFTGLLPQINRFETPALFEILRKRLRIYWHNIIKQLEEKKLFSYI